MRLYAERPDLRMVRTPRFCEYCGGGYVEDVIEEGAPVSVWRTACQCEAGSGACELRDTTSEPGGARNDSGGNANRDRDLDEQW